MNSVVLEFRLHQVHPPSCNILSYEGYAARRAAELKRGTQNSLLRDGHSVSDEDEEKRQEREDREAVDRIASLEEQKKDFRDRLAKVTITKYSGNNGNSTSANNLNGSNFNGSLQSPSNNSASNHVKTTLLGSDGKEEPVLLHQVDNQKSNLTWREMRSLAEGMVGHEVWQIEKSRKTFDKTLRKFLFYKFEGTCLIE